MDLRLDHLLLDGFDPADRERISAALTSELARLAALHGPPSAGTAAALPPVQADLRPGMPPEEAGAAIARAVWSRLGPASQE